MRYFFHIAYHGFNYRGWQRQVDAVSVQEIIEEALTRILKEPIIISGCGRTDAMVSASQYFFHIDVKQTWDFDLLFRLNKVLPPDIAVFDIIPVEDTQHARFHASARTYDFFIHTYKDPFLSRISSIYLLKDLDLQEMKKAVALFPKYNDYRVFCKSPDKHNTTICHVTAAHLFTDAKGDKLRFSITANRFLKTMIRILMGKLLEIGKGEFTVAELEHCLATQTPPKLILPAHPQGLFLSKVTYPFLDLPPRTEFESILQNKENNSWLEL
jgi:tRNA pseudouridine38-40 synthase